MPVAVRVHQHVDDELNPSTDTDLKQSFMFFMVGIMNHDLSLVHPCINFLS